MGNSEHLCNKISHKSSFDSSSLTETDNESSYRQTAPIAAIQTKPIFIRSKQPSNLDEESPEDIAQAEQTECNSKKRLLELARLSNQQTMNSHVQKNQSSQKRNVGKMESKQENKVKCLEEMLLQEQKKWFQQKIGVNWNSFIKIKNKSYLQDYVFMKEIGKGSFGSVVKIRMKHGGMERAAKIVKSSLLVSQSPEAGKLLTEISISMKLDHPNLVKLFQVFEYRGQYAMVLELCQGGDLFNHIKHDRFFTEANAAAVMRQLFSAVNYIHKQGVMHRDIKPENIFVDKTSKTIKLGDFGLATPFTRQSRFTSSVGTPYYMAPQVIRNNYDYRCDLWSCGVILYILLCGSPPFNGNSNRQILEKILHHPIDFRNSIWKKRSKEAKDLIARLLCKNPDERVSAEEALNNIWLTSARHDESANMKDFEVEVINNLQSFYFQNRLKAVVYTFIASQLYSNQEKENLLRVFREIDQDGDGVLEKSELISTFNTYSRSSLSETEIEMILQLIDTNGSGKIDFTEFLVAATNQQKMLEEKRLSDVFNYLDTDHSGFITIEEIKAFLDGSSETSAQIKRIFDDVDINGDGKISKKEFLALLLKAN